MSLIKRSSLGIPRTAAKSAGSLNASLTNPPESKLRMTSLFIAIQIIQVLHLSPVFEFPPEGRGTNGTTPKVLKNRLCNCCLRVS